MVSRMHRAHEDGAGFSFKLNNDGGDVLVGWEGEDDATGYNIEVSVEGMWVIELNADGHDGGVQQRRAGRAVN